MTPEPVDLTNWWEFQRRARGAREERHALELGEPADVLCAGEAVAEAVVRGGPLAVKLLARLDAVGPGVDGGITVGTGPLEDLIHLHGNDLVDALDDQARQSPAFARTLGHVSLERGTLRDETEQRLRRWITPDSG